MLVIDTRTAWLRLVDLPASYSFRSLGRTPVAAYVTEPATRQVHVVDLAPQEVVDSLDVCRRFRTSCAASPAEQERPHPLAT